MAEEGKYSPRMYWHYARRERVKAKFFAPYRALPALLVSIAQFWWKHKAHTAFTEMWITIAIIVSVYLGIFMFESLWGFTVLTPPKIYQEQIELIADLMGKNSFLEDRLRGPQVSSQEKRRRESVSEIIKGLEQIGREMLRYIDDHGEVRNLALISRFNDVAVHAFVNKTVPAGLVLYADHKMRINPELKSALEFVLDSEYSQQS